jgi:hypothetical protein
MSDNPTTLREVLEKHFKRGMDCLEGEGFIPYGEIDTEFEQAQKAILTWLDEVIGEHEDIDDPMELTSVLEERDIRNKLRFELRKQFGINHD